MANYNSLKATINADIKTNHEQEITGSILNSVLIGMVDNLAAGYLFKGVATPATNPGTPDQNVYYIAGAGTYTHFNNTTIDDGEVGVFLYNGAWTVERVSLASTNYLTISTDVPDLSYNESEPQTIADQMGQSIADVLATGAVRFVGDVAVSYYKVIGYYGDEGGYITFIGNDNIYQYDVNASGYITGEQVTSLAPDDELSETSENAVQNKVVKAAFDAKQDKDTNAVAGNVAVMDANGNSKGSNVPLDNVAKIDGQYDTLTSGYAGNLIDKSDAGSEQQIMFRKTGGATEVAESTRAMFKRLLGRSLVWNQRRLDTVISQTSNGITMGYDNLTGCLTFTGTATNTTYVGFTSALDHLLTVGHKYYMHFKFVEGYISGLIFGSVNNPLRSSNSEYSGISVVNNTGADIGYQSIPAGTEINAKVWLNLIDLTVMYGAGYEPGTVAEFESVYNKPYYPHCTAAFNHNVAQTYEATGQNQWDEEWEEGGISPSTGQNSTTLPTLGRPKNYIRVVPATKYYFYVEALVGDTGNNFVVFGYDANKNYLGILKPNAQNSELTLGGDVCYIRFHSPQATFAQNICINLSNPDINGTYAPYVKAIATLGLSAFRVKDGQGNITTINGLKGTGATYNEIDVENKTYTERVEMRAYQSGDDSDTSVLTDGTNTLAPLAEPVVYDLVDDMPEYSQVWGVGTENILPEGVDENGVPLTTPLRAVIYYPKDYTGIINNLPKNYISTASLTNMLNALKSAGIIRSFTMVWNAETQTYNFTIS